MAKGLRRLVRFECEPELSPVLVKQPRMVKALVYLVLCADHTAPAGAMLLVRGKMKGTRPALMVGYLDDMVDESAVIQDPDSGLSGTGEPEVDEVDEDLMLSACGTLLRAHGVSLHANLEEGRPDARGDMFWFELPVLNP